MEKKLIKQRREGTFLVLREDTNYKTRIDEHKRFVRTMKRRGFIKVETIPGDDETTPFQDIWLNPERTNSVYFVHDPVVDTNYLRVRDENDGDLVGDLLGWFPRYDRSELLETADLALKEDDEDEAARAIFDVAVAFYICNRAPIMMFERYLNSSNPEIRRGAIRAIGFQLWPECALLLEKVIQEDPEEDIRAYAQEVLEQIQQPDIQELD